MLQPFFHIPDKIIHSRSLQKRISEVTDLKIWIWVPGLLLTSWIRTELKSCVWCPWHRACPQKVCEVYALLHFPEEWSKAGGNKSRVIFCIDYVNQVLSLWYFNRKGSSGPYSSSNSPLTFPSQIIFTIPQPNFQHTSLKNIPSLSSSFLPLHKRHRRLTNNTT